MQRSTRQREAILKAIADADRPVGPREILADAARRVRGLGLATVYRAIKSQLADGRIVQIDIPGEPPRYEMAGKDHHHHFSCVACGKVYEIEGCPGDLRSMAPRGFEFLSHEVVIFGRCATCVTGGTVPPRKRRARAA